MLQRIYIITGKGGVGKTIFSLALTKYLISKGHKAVYNHFDQDPPTKLCSSLDVPILKLEDEESLKIYVGKKLHSGTLGSFVVKAPFFSSLFNIIPGLRNLVTLGHLVDMLREDPELIIVLDSPSSGHVLTLFETPQNFKNIFKTGPLVDDINKIFEITKNPELLKTIILFLPSMMVLHEALELKNKLTSLEYGKPDLIMNNSFFHGPLKDSKDLPDFLKSKLEIEGELITWYEKNLGNLETPIPHIFDEKASQIVEKLIPYMEHLI